MPPHGSVLALEWLMAATALSLVEAMEARCHVAFHRISAALNNGRRRRRPRKQQVGILQQARHQNVVGVHQFYKEEKFCYYVVLESLDGGELFDRMVKKVWPPAVLP